MWTLKAGKVARLEVDATIEALNALKLEKAAVEKDFQATLSSGKGSGNKEVLWQAVSNTLEHHLFYIKSFNIYGGILGLYVYGRLVAPSSTSIGKRYARTDELGVPFAITVDSTSSVTLRERDSKDQIRVDVKEAASVVKDVAEGVRSWDAVWETFPHHSSASADE
ncbi:hypothetical protein C1H46_036498 [Malus baccata]|uniref:Anticodon-binding domain-containing protein n=1 Tax=Malus baccata TaxID=106549 RepID=A0A540KUQ4_MALBA|nr:hypothetical protein C1H46_036498 [Malus baccata]